MTETALQTGGATGSQRRRPRCRCGMCGGRVRIRRGTWNPWVDCTSCKGWSGSEPTGGTIGHRLRVALAVPTWSWWTLHGPASRLLAPPIYRWWPRLVHHLGGHTWRANPLKGSRCSWCGLSRPAA